MATLVEPTVLAQRLNLDLDDDAVVSKLSVIVMEASVFVNAITNTDWDGLEVIPDRVKTAALSIATRRYLERDSNLANFRLGEYSEGYVAPGAFTAEDLTSFEKTLLGPWLTTNTGMANVPVVSPFHGAGSGYVPVAGTREPFPFLEED